MNNESKEIDRRIRQVLKLLQNLPTDQQTTPAFEREAIKPIGTQNNFRKSSIRIKKYIICGRGQNLAYKIIVYIT